jgi:acetylglutamate kinase
MVNVNADAAASAVASALHADKLLFVTDVEGIMDGDGKRSDNGNDAFFH